jgi:hypothetical protein
MLMRNREKSITYLKLKHMRNLTPLTDNQLVKLYQDGEENALSVLIYLPGGIHPHH